MASTLATKTDRTRLLWLALAMTSGIGPTRVRKLLDGFDRDLEHIFHASLTSLEAVGITAASAQSIFTGKSIASAEEEFSKTQAAGAEVLTPDDGLWPERINEIYDPPIVLYVRGDAALLGEPSIAVVGTRHPTPYGIGMAQRLSQDLANQGLIILSGMARGIDTHAHRGALAARGKTIAVWGTGIDVPYPRENKKLSEEILAAGGTLISEFPVGTSPTPQNFPIRNRIISGLSAGVLVVEAAEYSGTRITSRCALEQNREVFAVPGNVTNKNSWTPNTLIKQGAKLTATWEDIWEDLPSDIRLAVEAKRATDGGGDESRASAAASLFSEAGLSEAGSGGAAASGAGPYEPARDRRFSAQEQRVLSALRQDEATQMDELIERVEQHMSPSEVFAALFELELAGKIRQMAGKNFVRSF